jgi:RNA polymerase sigma factor (sigma-70 family)
MPSADRKVGALARARRAVLSDDRLAKQAAAGDIGAFEAIFSRYQDDLYRFCVGILREPQDAQDAVQNTMIKAMRALPGERRQMQLKPWLYRIAHNEAVELRRRERSVEELPVTVGDVSALTDERAEENGRLRTLLADVADLPERQRAALVLREVNGLGFGEIAAALGTSPGAVRQALYEARRGLAEMDEGRDMECERAIRVVSDADGRPRDRGVRAHLRDCSPCRRFQTELRERGRTFAAISPIPGFVAAGALKAALGGSGAAAGGSGVAAVAGGAGAGTGAAGMAAGSIGASVLAKPAVGLLAVLAIGAAVDRGAIFEAGRNEPVTADLGGSPPARVAQADRSVPRTTHAIAWYAGGLSTPAATDERLDSSAAPASAPHAASAPAPEHLGASSTVEPLPRGGGDQQGDDAPTAPSVPKSSNLEGATHDEALLPVAVDPVIAPDGSGEPDAADEGVIPPGQADEETASQGPAKKEIEPTTESEAVPPGQAKEDAAATPASAPSEGSPVPAPAAEAPKVPPGQAKKEAVPPGQAKKQAEPTAEPTTSEASASMPEEVAGHIPPGQAKKEEAATE